MSTHVRHRLVLMTAVLLAAVFALPEQALETANAQADAPRYALLIGITNYKAAGINKIDGCENNVPLLAQTLIDNYGFKKENVRTLLDGQATKDAIIGQFRSHLIDNARAAKKDSKEAVVVYYFCGHGSQYPDQDGDENDGLDETFVAYDSRTGGVPDILDDEIDDLKAELRPWTTNTTLILDSCHSGTGSRNGDQLISMQAPNDPGKHPPYKRRFPPTSDADAHTYTEIAASASANTAKSESKEFCNCEKPYSLMTKALIEALNRASHSTTYRMLGQEIAATVAVRSRQDPRVEGNRDTILFGGAAKRTRPFIEVDRLAEGGKMVIRAGAVQGLKVGSQVAVYSSASTTNTGDKDWLTNGVVAEVRDFQSVVQLPSAAESPNAAKVDKFSRVVLTSPVFGGGPVLVALDMTPAGSKASDADQQFVTRISDQLKAEQLLANEMVRLVPPQAVTPASLKDARGALRLKRDKFAAAFPGKMEALARFPKAVNCVVDEGRVILQSPPVITPETEVYYLEDGLPGNPPLFGRFFLPDENTPNEIARVIRNYVLRTNLEGLNNAASTLPSNIALTVNRIANAQIVNDCRDGKVVQRIGSKPAPSDLQTVTNGKIPVGSIFNFKVKNISGDIRRKADQYAAGEPLYITAIYLLNNGDIEVIHPRLGSKEALGDGIERTFGGYIASKPTGAEQLIVIVSKTFVDFGFYESMTASRRPQSTLERLLKQSGTKTRDSATLIPDEPNTWGVIRLDLDIVD